MAVANMNLIGVFVTKLWPVQALACGGGAAKNIKPPTFSNFGDIIIVLNTMIDTSYIFVPPEITPAHVQSPPAYRSLMTN